MDAIPAETILAKAAEHRAEAERLRPLIRDGGHDVVDWAIVNAHVNKAVALEELVS